MFNIFNQSNSEDILGTTTIIKVTNKPHQPQNSKFNKIITKPLTFALGAFKSRGALTHVRCNARAAVHASHPTETHG